jgi:uncharacterized protein
MRLTPKPATPHPLAPAEMERLQTLLDGVPPPLEPLDVSVLDGFLCAVLLQPTAPPQAQWLRFVTDSEGSALPRGYDAAPLHALVLRRHAELDDAIARRRWFDPWVFELDADASPSQAVYAWVAGFALGVEHFPALMRLDEAALLEPLALLYRHLDADDLEDGDDLLEHIETLEPPATLAEAVEELVRATLLIADLSRPVPVPARAAQPPRPAAPRRR